MGQRTQGLTELVVLGVGGQIGPQLSQEAVLVSKEQKGEGTLGWKEFRGLHGLDFEEHVGWQAEMGEH